jgi:hypothetical protein
MKSSIQELWEQRSAPATKVPKGFTLNDLTLADKEPGKVFFSPAPPRGFSAWLWYLTLGSLLALVFHRSSARP